MWMLLAQRDGMAFGFWLAISIVYLLSACFGFRVGWFTAALAVVDTSLFGCLFMGLDMYAVPSYACRVVNVCCYQHVCHVFLVYHGSCIYYDVISC
ncbi:hypothetical protein F5B20DRAFT_325863 [Whalleya microplaca]|nr:hypothetical protein F5B20DRAFT_325863 [Whalleya microplaca]